MDAPLEEAGAAVAGEDAVVLAGGTVPADPARHVQKAAALARLPPNAQRGHSIASETLQCTG